MKKNIEYRGAPELNADGFQALKKALKKAGKLEIEIQSSSMAPLITPGQRLLLLPIPKDYVPKEFDICVYWDSEVLICHYFIRSAISLNKDEEVWIFGSLESRYEDFPVNPNRLLGLVKLKVPQWLRFKVRLISFCQRFMLQR